MQKANFRLFQVDIYFLGMQKNFITLNLLDLSNKKHIFTEVL